MPRRPAPARHAPGPPAAPAVTCCGGRRGAGARARERQQAGDQVRQDRRAAQQVAGGRLRVRRVARVRAQAARRPGRNTPQARGGLAVYKSSGEPRALQHAGQPPPRCKLQAAGCRR